jgi:hypothetical protein
VAARMVMRFMILLLGGGFSVCLHSAGIAVGVSMGRVSYDLRPCGYYHLGAAS